MSSHNEGNDKTHPWKPAAEHKFKRRAVEMVVEGVIAEEIGDKPYNFQDSVQMAKDICAKVQERVKEMDYIRYKLVVQTFIAEAGNQGIRISSRCLWDPDTDGFAEFTYSNQHMHVTTVVFGLYWE